MEEIFVYAAPRMRLMRKLLKMVPELVEDVEFCDFVVEIKRLQRNDNNLFQKRFPLLVPKNVLRTSSFDEDVRKDYPLPKLKKWWRMC